MKSRLVTAMVHATGLLSFCVVALLATRMFDVASGQPELNSEIASTGKLRAARILCSGDVEDRDNVPNLENQHSTCRTLSDSRLP
jgi:hypothetical protein